MTKLKQLLSYFEKPQPCPTDVLGPQVVELNGNTLSYIFIIKL